MTMNEETQSEKLKRVVVDKDILGWANDQRDELSEQYYFVQEVGKDEEIPQRKTDAEIASYCKRENCDLLTADKSAYIHFFDAGVKTVQIEKYGWYNKGDRPIYLIRIIK